MRESRESRIQSPARASRSSSPQVPALPLLRPCYWFSPPWSGSFCLLYKFYLLTNNWSFPFFSRECKRSQSFWLVWGNQGHHTELTALTEEWGFHELSWGFHELNVLFMVKCTIPTGGGERNFWNCTRPGLRTLRHTSNQHSQQPCNTYSFSQEIPLSQFTALTTALQSLWLSRIFKCVNLFK